MSAITPEEEAGYTRFTVVLPTDVVKRIDILKAYAGLDNRNRVIMDAIEALDHTCLFMAMAMANDDLASCYGSNGTIPLYIATHLGKYWTPLISIAKTMKQSGKT